MDYSIGRKSGGKNKVKQQNYNDYIDSNNIAAIHNKLN